MAMKINLLMLLFMIVLNLTAQTNEEAKTAFGNEKTHLGFFISPSCQFGKIVGSNAVVPGIGGGIILNHKLYLGLIYHYTASENTPTGESDSRFYLDQKWGGVRCEYAMMSGKVIHLTFPIEVGIGELELDLKDNYESEVITIPRNNASFLYLKPGIAAEVNLFKHLKLNFATSYRFVSDVTFRNLNQKDLKGIYYSLSLKIGIF
jgi:hypothetical protein